MMCLGLDVHEKWTTVVALDPETGELRRFDRVPNEAEAFRRTLGELGGPLHGVMEAGWNSWAVYDLLEPLFSRLLMADPAEMKRRMSGRGAKTDRRDALQMALLLAEDRVPAIWVPDRKTRDLRVLTRGRARISQLITQVGNQIHALGASFGHDCPASKLRTQRGRSWAETMELPPLASEMRDRWLAVLTLMEENEAQLETMIRQIASQDPRAKCLATMPGVGALSALTIVAEVGDVDRFDNAKSLVGFAGLGPQVHQSGEELHYGPLPSSGNPWLRRIMVLAAQHVARMRADDKLKRQYWRAFIKHGPNTAKVATARKMLVVAHHLLRHLEDYVERPPQAA